MKYLKKYNEDKSVDFEFDKEYIKDCFIEFIDDPKKYDLDEDGDVREHSVEYSLGINCPDLTLNHQYNIDDFIKYSEELANFYKEIESSIDKVKIKYPDVVVKLDHDNYVDRGELTGTKFVWVRFIVYVWNKK
jgi:hypothetical protein